MKLYKNRNAPPGERWHSSKTGLAVSETTEVELPKEGRQGMAAFLNVNERELGSAVQALDPLQQAELRAVAAAQPPSVTRERQLTADGIVSFILDDATVSQVETVFAALGTRFKEQADATR